LNFESLTSQLTAVNWTSWTFAC